MKKIIRILRVNLVTIAILTWDKTKVVGKAFRREARETEIASKILMKIVKGKEVTPNEIKFLKDQSVDLGKALTIIGLQAVPGSSIAIVAIEKVGQKHGFTLFPKAQMEPPHDLTNYTVQNNSLGSNTMEVK